MLKKIVDEHLSQLNPTTLNPLLQFFQYKIDPDFQVNVQYL